MVEGKNHEKKGFSDSNVMIIDDDYDLKAPCSNEDDYYNIIECQDLAGLLGEHKIKLDSDENIKIHDEENDNTYYAAVVKIDKENDYYLVAFIC